MEVDRRSTKIPGPPAALKQLTASEANVARKRKAASPMKDGPVAKRQAPVETGCDTATNAPQNEDSWEHISQQLGWSVADCLNHKLSFKKKEDPKAKHEAMGLHIKRLRAAGWHLLHVMERHELDITALTGCLEREEKARTEEAAEHATAAAALQKDIADLQARLSQQQAATAQQSACAQQLQEAVETGKGKLAESAAFMRKLQDEQTRAKEQIAEYATQVSSLRELHQQAQKYNTQLQEYNTKLQQDVALSDDKLQKLQVAQHKWAEEGAELKGRLTAHEAQLEVMQVNMREAECARSNLAEDLSRLRMELEKVSAERDSSNQANVALKAELDRYRDVTGNTVEALEREKAVKAQLETQNKAQAEVNQGLQEGLQVLKQQKALAEALAEGRGQEVQGLKQEVHDLTGRLTEAESRVQQGELIRRKLHNTILELKGNIRVFCRVRPLVGSDALTHTAAVDQLVQFPSSGDLLGRAIALQVPADKPQQAPQKYDFAFDKVFAPAAGQEEVFDEISQLVQSALDGYKVCIFAYGQTGSGKTHTMLGTPEERGMIPRAMDQIFASSAAMEAEGWSFDMKASMLEIYNEEYKDLLSKSLPAGKKHQVSHDDKGVTSVSFLEGVDVRRPGRVADLLARAMRQRAVGATATNEHSSRSHMVFSLNITGSNAASGQQVHGVLNLIDLAGSERLSKSLAQGDRLKETQAINKSLSALGDVIMALANKEAHIPYRNSKLTYLLQPCLGGDAKTLMFVNVAPVPEAANESLCSLRFAAKVNACEVGTARRNVAAKQ
ncbi:hypothetical protein ABBQ38_013330 [Trebouxia sp. C0009 RCD-2024]